MTDIYKKAYLELFLTHDVSKIPEQIFIDENEEVALHLWNNIIDHEANPYDESSTNIKLYEKTDYIKFKVPELYHIYKNNIHFWEKIIGSSFSYKLLFLPEFKDDFSDIYESIICNKDFLINLYNKFKDRNILTLNQSLLDNETQLHKIAILNSGYVHISEIEGYFDDLPFMLNLFKREVTKHGNGLFLYNNLSQDLKENKEIIQTILDGKKNNWEFFSVIPKKFQEEFLHAVELWTSPTLKEFCKLDVEIQQKLLHKAIQHLPQLIQKKPTTYWNKAIELLSKDLSYITVFNNIDIQNISKSVSVNNTLYNKLKKYAENYNSVTNTRTNNMLNELVKTQVDLFPILKNNFYYKISSLLNDKRRINKEEFYLYFNDLYDKFLNKSLTYDDCNKLVNSLVSMFTIDTAKELRLPKRDAFSILKTEKEHENLQEYLNTITSNKNTTTNKIKI